MKPDYTDDIINKRYLVEYTYNGITKKITGTLLNYYSRNIILLSSEGIYHIKYPNINFMCPVPVFKKTLTNTKESYKNKTLQCFKKIAPKLYPHSEKDQASFINLVTDILNEDYETIEHETNIKLFEEDQLWSKY